MVYITGDCHGQFNKIFKFIEKIKPAADDSIIVLGDMGMYWRHDKKDCNKFILDWENHPNRCELYWIEGNHENFKLISELRVDENNMAVCSSHIHMLMRGSLYNFEGKKCLAIGGADSVDRGYRQKGLNWWEEETISDSDLAAALISSANGVDYVFSHTAPAHIIEEYKVYLCELALDQDTLDCRSNMKLETLYRQIEFKHWYFGHMHHDIHLNDKFTCLYNTFEALE